MPYLESGVEGEFLGQNLGEEVDAEKRLRIALTPAIYRPLGAQELHRTVGEIEENLVGAAVEFLWKCHQRLDSPIGAIGRAPDGNVNAFLFDDTREPQSQNQRSRLKRAQIDIGRLS